MGVNAKSTTPFQAQEAFARFCKNLDEIETKIEARNKVLVEGGKVPYTILLPSKIPAGIAVWGNDGFYIWRKINWLTFQTFASEHLMFWHLSTLYNQLIRKNVGHRFITFMGAPARACQSICVLCTGIGEICHWWHCRRQCNIFACGANFYWPKIFSRIWQGFS